MDKIKYLVLFIVGFCVYITLEVLFRGYSFPLMGLCGAIALLLIDQIHNKITWNFDLLLQGVIGSAIITLIELMVGLWDKYFLHINMWDYSYLWLDYNGVICPLFSFIWMIMSICAVVLADTINYYVFDSPQEPPYYKVFGKVIFKFKAKSTQ